MRFKKIPFEKLKVFPLKNRYSKSHIQTIALNIESKPAPVSQSLEQKIDILAQKIIKAREKGTAVILAFGAHLIKNGLGPLVIKLLENDWITHLATNGAGSIHDWEFAYLGESEEDVRANVATGTFGTWDETGRLINLAILTGNIKGIGYGESVGSLILNEKLFFPDERLLQQDILKNLHSTNNHIPAKVELMQSMKIHGISGGTCSIRHPYKAYSVFCNSVKHGVPITVHPGIGYDIIYNNPHANGAAIGRGAHVDYKKFVNSVYNLSNGVFMSIGSAIMAPQIFEKALSISNNIALQANYKIQNFSLFINDLQPMEWDWSKGEPPKSSPDYYLRFLKTFHRMGGSMSYVAADNRVVLHHLYHKLLYHRG